MTEAQIWVVIILLFLSVPSVRIRWQREARCKRCKNTPPGDTDEKASER